MPRVTNSKTKQLMDEINAKMPGALLLGSDPSFVTRYLSTGVIPIDVLLKGGLPRNRCTEVYGDYSTLKSFIALCAVATTQAAGGTAALVDTEHSYDPEWLIALGGNPKELLLKQPDHVEQACEVSEVLIRNGVDLLVWDSIAAGITKSAAEKMAGDDTQPANMARFMSRALPRLTSANSTTAMMWINQTRDKIGITYGSPETTPGGRAMPFFASYRVRITKAGKVTEPVKSWDGEKFVEAKQQIAQKVKCTLEKSKLNKPFRDAWFTFDYRHGKVDDVGFLISQGLEEGLITVSGPPKGVLTWTVPDLWESGVRGKDAFREALDDSEVLWLKDQLMAAHGVASPGDPPPARSKGGRQKSAS